MVDKLNDLLEKHGFARTAESDQEHGVFAVLEHLTEINVCSEIALWVDGNGCVSLAAGADDWSEWAPVGRRHAELLLDVFEMVKEF